MRQCVHAEGALVRESYNWPWEHSWEASRFTWALQIDSRTARSSRNGVAILQGMWAIVRAHRLHDWASPGCGQCAATCAASDSRGGDGGWVVTCDVIVENPASWCTRQPQCCPCEWHQRDNRHTGCGEAEGSKAGWYRRRCVLTHPRRTPQIPCGTGKRCVESYRVSQPQFLGYWQEGASQMRVRKQCVIQCQPANMRTRRKGKLLFLWQCG